MPEPAVYESIDPRQIALLPSNHPIRVKFEREIAERLKADREAEAARTAARQVEPPHSPAECRAALTQAISARDKAEQTLAKVRAAASQATANEKAARERLAACEGTAAKAKAEHVERCETAARQGKPLPSPGAMRATNIEIADATEQLEAARAAVANISERLPDLERELRRAQDSVAVAADNVVRSVSLRNLVVQAHALQSDLRSRRSALLYLLDEGLVGDESERKLAADLLSDAALPSAVSINGRVIQATRVHGHDGGEAWRAARAALREDADAALPI